MSLNRSHANSLIKLASGEVRKIDSRSLATIGVLSNPDQKNIKLGKAGRKRTSTIVRPAN